MLITAIGIFLVGISFDVRACNDNIIVDILYTRDMALDIRYSFLQKDICKNEDGFRGMQAYNYGMRFCSNWICEASSPYGNINKHTIIHCEAEDGMPLEEHVFIYATQTVLFRISDLLYLCVPSKSSLLLPEVWYLVVLLWISLIWFHLFLLFLCITIGKSILIDVLWCS